MDFFYTAFTKFFCVLESSRNTKETSYNICKAKIVLFTIKSKFV